jgi:protein-S-isoprenylcysteine O-methyltransferase Ste14
LSAWRHLRAIGLLPAMGAGVVPAVILAASGWGNPGWGLEALSGVLTVVLGATLVSTGLALMWRTIALLARLGEGTLAPWDPTTKLVVAGPYRYVRNPMIVGVALVLAGEAAIFGSVWVLGWMAVFLAINAVWFPRVEEPALERRFGEDYRRYVRSVPRWVPRLRPWSDGPDVTERQGCYERPNAR